MKHIIFSLSFLFIVSPVFAAADTSVYAKFTEIKTIESDFTMYKHLSIAQRPLVSKGKFYFERPGFLKWVYTSPFPSGIILDGKKAWSWRGEGSEKQIRNISSQPFAKIMARQIYIFVSLDLEQIGARYNMEELKNGIILRPKDNSAKQTMDMIKLHFSPEQDAVEKVEMIEKSGDKTVIDFTNVNLNSHIPQEAKEP
ncbi:MAG: outer membrane lipoprotein carrier protein LolA [Elusimicrobiota bacterium]|jgi:outer membrane lipoprotein carrier protein|nr:outer membrane lipoprotein carrier protein LolA [Elusimicrobiota bacterium]